MLPQLPESVQEKGWINRWERLPNIHEANNVGKVEYLMDDYKTTVVAHYNVHYSPQVLVAWRSIPDEEIKKFSPEQTPQIQPKSEEVYPTGTRYQGD